MTPPPHFLIGANCHAVVSFLQFQSIHDFVKDVNKKNKMIDTGPFQKDDIFNGSERRIKRSSIMKRPKCHKTRKTRDRSMLL